MEQMLWKIKILKKIFIGGNYKEGRGEKNYDRKSCILSRPKVFL
jgi:hypothetical protein